MTSAGLDMPFHSARIDSGAERASRMAQRLVIPAHCDSVQAQLAMRPLLSGECNAIAQLMDWA